MFCAFRYLFKARSAIEHYLFGCWIRHAVCDYPQLFGAFSIPLCIVRGHRASPPIALRCRVVMNHIFRNYEASHYRC